MRKRFWSSVSIDQNETIEKKYEIRLVFKPHLYYNTDSDIDKFVSNMSI